MAIGGDVSYGLGVETLHGILQGHQTAVVYGWQHCSFAEVAKAFASTRRFFDVKDWRMGNDDRRKTPHPTFEGKKIYQIPSHQYDEGGKKWCRRVCKSGLTNLVFENYKRQLDDKQTIPLFFCLEKEEQKKEYKTTKKAFWQKGKTIIFSLTGS